MRIALLVAALLVPACSAVVENRVESALVEAGVPAAMAGCMAEIWAGRLSVGQLRGIQNFASQLRAEGRRLTLASLAQHVATWNDPEAALVVTTSAARCAFR